MVSDSVNIITITQNNVSVQYDTLVGNSPSTNANTLFLWQTSGPQIPWGTTPYGSNPIVETGSVGAFGVMGNITQSGYIVGYAAGSVVGNIVATSFVPNTTTPPTGPINFSPNLSLYSPPTSTTVSFLYSLPPGCQPQTNGHWIGIFTGKYAFFSTVPDAQGPTAIPTNNSNTSITLYPNLTANAYYTAAYFAGGYNSTTPGLSKLNSMCALCTFQVPS
jgi:hypothetical protein